MESSPYGCFFCFIKAKPDVLFITEICSTLSCNEFNDSRFYFVITVSTLLTFHVCASFFRTFALQFQLIFYNF